MSDREKALDKIRKLLRLSKSANEHEAANAAARAAELMAQHELSEAELRVTDGDVKAEPIGDEKIDGETHKSASNWKGVVANGLAKSMGCRMYWTGGAIKIFGRTSNIQAVSYTYQYLIAEIERLCDERWATVKGQTWDHPKAWRMGFRLGASQTVYSRLVQQAVQKEAQQKVASKMFELAGAASVQSQALVLVKRDELEVINAYKAKSKGFKSKGYASTKSASGYHEGRAAGEGISLGGGKGLKGATRALKGE